MAVVRPVGDGSLAGKTQGIAVILPDIPLWLPDQARKAIDTLTRNTLRLALQEVAGRIGDAAPRDKGTLAQSFAADPATSTGGIELTGSTTVGELTGRVFSSLPYAIVMDEGRRPGQPISRAGIDAIGLWAQRKLGLSFAEAERAKWAIANVIVKRGIQGTGYFNEGFKSAEPTVQSLFRILSDQIARDLTGATGTAN